MTLAIRQLEARRGSFALGPVSITLEAGDCLAVMGENGAGKTTLLETLAGFLPAVAGQLLLDGRDLVARAPERRRFAYLPRDMALFPHLDVAHNVAFGCRYVGQPAEHVEALIREFGLDPVRTRYPHQLSTGQAQRVAFARALAMSPAVLLLDEPTANLDLAGRRGLNAGLEQALAGRGVIVVHATHGALEGIPGTDHLLVLDRGRVVQAGTPQAVFRSPANAGVAAHLGISNLWPVEVLEATLPRVRIRIGDCELACESPGPVPAAPVAAGIGPGEVELSTTPPADAVNRLQLVVRSLQVNGHAATLELSGGPPGLRASLPPTRADGLAAGQTVWVRLPPDRIRLLPGAPD